MKKIIIFTLIFASPIFSQWIKLNPSSTLYDLTKTDFVDQNAGFAVGDSGIVLFTSNAGTSWINRNTSPVDLNFVDFTDINTGYVSTENGNMFKTINGGVTWATINPGTNSVYSFHFSDASTGILAGGYELRKTTNGGINWSTLLSDSNRFFLYMYFINPQTGWVSCFNGELLKTTNRGINWESLNAPTGKLFFLNENTGWVHSSSIFSNWLKKTTDGGQSWIDQLNPISSISSITFLDANTGFCAGLRGLIKTTNGGTNWISYNFYNNGILNDIIKINSASLLVFGSRSVIGRSTDSGNSWNNVSKDFQTDLRNIKFFDSNNGNVSGDYGLFAKTTDGGLTWKNKFTGTLEGFQSSYFISSSTGWLLTNRNKILKTTNGGDNWSLHNLPTGKYLYSICFINANTGSISGDSGYISITSNGGNNWIDKGLEISSPVYMTKWFANGNMISTSRDSLILVSSNGGNNWIISNMTGGHSLYNVCLIDGQTAIVSGFYKLFKTINSGLNWSEIPNDLPIGSKYITYIENTLFAITGLNVYKSDNGGINWAISALHSEPNVCFRLSFINKNTGWTCGENGLIYKNINSSAIGIEPNNSAIPKDFILRQNFPNPFNPKTKISFDLPVSSFVILKVYGILGQQVSILVNEELEAGGYSIDFDGSNLPSGIYFYKIETSKYSEFRKMILIK